MAEIHYVLYTKESGKICVEVYIENEFYIEFDVDNFDLLQYEEQLRSEIDAN